MSFSGQVKEELAGKFPEASCCQEAELLALLELGGAGGMSPGDSKVLVLHTERFPVARKGFTLLEKTFNIKANVSVRRNRIRDHTSYFIVISNRCLTFPAFSKLAGRTCCRRAYLRGAFLAAGSMSDPRKAYHFEIVCPSRERAEKICELMLRFSLEGKIVRRKRAYVVYLKEGAQIVDMLNIMGAHVSLLELENVRILKEMRNSVNRKVNCETANLSKTVSAAIRQVEDIEWIRRTIGLDSLPENLRDIAELRLEYPDAALAELGELLEPPVGKSGVNHRLRRIREIAESLRNSKEEFA